MKSVLSSDLSTMSYSFTESEVDEVEVLKKQYGTLNAKYDTLKAEHEKVKKELGNVTKTKNYYEMRERKAKERKKLLTRGNKQGAKVEGEAGRGRKSKSEG